MFGVESTAGLPLFSRSVSSCWTFITLTDFSSPSSVCLMITQSFNIIHPHRSQLEKLSFRIESESPESELPEPILGWQSSFYNISVCVIWAEEQREEQLERKTRWLQSGAVTGSQLSLHAHTEAGRYVRSENTPGESRLRLQHNDIIPITSSQSLETSSSDTNVVTEKRFYLLSRSGDHSWESDR